MPKAHPPELKAAYLADVPDLGISAAAKKHGISKAAGSGWARSANVRTVHSAKTAEATEAAKAQRAMLREQIQTQLLAKALDMLERMDEEHIVIRGKGDRADTETWDKAPADACQRYATSAGILIDKSQLLGGGATSRTETIEPIDQELRRLVEQMTP